MRRARQIVVSQTSVKILYAHVNSELLDKLLSGVRFLDSGCWVRGNDSSIYTKVDGRPAHRVSYELLTGKKLYHQGCHSCDIPACINPEHIFDGTQSQNMKDAVKKGRMIPLTIQDKRPLTFFGPALR